jgi:hypothetical protein
VNVAVPCPERCRHCGGDGFDTGDARFSTGVSAACLWSVCRGCHSSWHARPLPGKGETRWAVYEVRPLPAMADYSRRTGKLAWIVYPVAFGAAALLSIEPVVQSLGSAMVMVPWLGAAVWTCYRELRTRCFWSCPQCRHRLTFGGVGPGPTCLYLCQRCDVLWDSGIAYEPYNPSDGS